MVKQQLSPSHTRLLHLKWPGSVSVNADYSIKYKSVVFPILLTPFVFVTLNNLFIVPQHRRRISCEPFFRSLSKLADFTEYTVFRIEDVSVMKPRLIPAGCCNVVS